MRPDARYIQSLKSVIQNTHDCNARHFTTVPIAMMRRGKPVWEGNVEVFDLTKHPNAGTCYAWGKNDNGTLHVTAILGVPPVNSAETAVKVSIGAKVAAPSKRIKKR